MSQRLPMTARMTFIGVACSAALLVGTSEFVTPPAVAQPEGEFEPVTMRRASVPGPPVEPGQRPPPDLGESSARFSPEGVWLNGAECAPAAFLARDEPSVDLHDPMLSDVAYGARPRQTLKPPGILVTRRRIAEAARRTGGWTTRSCRSCCAATVADNSTMYQSPPSGAPG